MTSGRIRQSLGAIVLFGCASAACEPSGDDDAFDSTATALDTDLTRCRTGEDRECTSADTSDPKKRHIIVASAGFTDAQRGDFWKEFDAVRQALTGDGAGQAWSRQKRGQLLFFGVFTVKMLVLTKRGVAGWVLPLLGGLAFATLVGISLTSAVWYFANHG